MKEYSGTNMASSGIGSLTTGVRVVSHCRPSMPSPNIAYHRLSSPHHRAFLLCGAVVGDGGVTIRGVGEMEERERWRATLRAV